MWLLVFCVCVVFVFELDGKHRKSPYIARRQLQLCKGARPNTPHSRFPAYATVARWREEVPEDFRYCPKLPQTISHARDLGLSGRETGLFCDAIRGLGRQLGCCFMQLPPHFSVQNLPVLRRFLEAFPGDIPLAVEVRHETFFKPTIAAEDFFQLLQLHGVSTGITDVAGRRDVCHLRLSTGRALIRFVGNGLHPSDYTRIQDWAGRLAGWFDGGLQEVYFFSHEPDNLLALFLAGGAGRAPGLATPRPSTPRTPLPLPPGARG